MAEAPRTWLEQIARRPDLPTYLGGWIASLAWLSVVGSTVGDVGFNLFIFVLTSIGFAVSFWLRGYVGTPHWPSIEKGVLTPSAVLRLLFMLVLVLPGLLGKAPFNRLVPEVALGTEEWLIGTGFMWAMALYSMGLISDGLIAFSAVLGISMLGLMGSNNVNPEVGIAFLAYLFGNVLMLSNMTLAHHSGVRRRQTSGRDLGRWIGDQLIVAGVTVSITALLSIGLAAVLQRVSPGGLLPRMAMPSWGGSANNAAGYASFADNMMVGLGGGLPEGSPVLRVQGPPEVRLRRRVYDRFTGRVWTSTQRSATMISPVENTTAVSIGANQQIASRLRDRVEQRVTIEYLVEGDFVGTPLVVEVLPLPGTRLATFSVDAHGDLRSPLVSGAKIEVVSQVPAATPEALRAAPPVDPAEYLNLLRVPRTVIRSVLPAAMEIRTGKSNLYDVAVAIQDWLEDEFTYDATAVIPERAEDSLDHYFRTRRGACDMIASAMVLLARQCGIPARVAVGYAPGERQADGSFLVTTAHAHAWAELYFEGYDWIPFDPAVPADEEEELLATDDLLLSLGGLRISRRAVGLLAVASVLLWLAGYVWREWWRSRPRFGADPAGAAAAAYHRANRLLHRRKLGRQRHETPREHLARLAAAATPNDADWLAGFTRLASLYERARYGLGEVSVEQTATLPALLRDIRRGLRRHRRA